MDAAALGMDTRVTLVVAGLIFLWALLLGVVKYEQIRRSPQGHAHPYTDIAHRSALLYAFATAMLAPFVEFGAFGDGVNLTAVAVLEFFFVTSIGSYMVHGLRGDTDNQLRQAPAAIHRFMVALIVGEIGAVAVLLVGFVVAAF